MPASFVSDPFFVSRNDTKVLTQDGRLVDNAQSDHRFGLTVLADDQEGKKDNNQHKLTPDVTEIN